MFDQPFVGQIRMPVITSKAAVWRRKLHLQKVLVILINESILQRI